MIIQVDGVNTQNKGAELMLIAILEELESRLPGSTVLLNPNGDLDISLLPNYNLTIKERFSLKNGRLARAILRRLKINYNYFTHFHALKGVDLMLDASGFQYSDQWKHSKADLKQREDYYKKLKSYGTKIVLMPQAFGPFETENGKLSVDIINNSFDLIFAREAISYKFLKENISNEKAIVIRSCDFTFKVKGIIPEKYKHLKDQVCIIPNKKMLTHTNAGESNYLNLIVNIIKFYKSLNKKVFLLNHEGIGDRKICEDIVHVFGEQLEIVDKLSAKEVKGVIGNSNLVVSSRFHGVASSLSQGVPCLATSWNHKYEMLFNDFNQENRILNSSNSWEENKIIVQNLTDTYSQVAGEIKLRKVTLIDEINKMWGKILE